MAISIHFEAFEHYLQWERRYSVHTLRAYMDDLKQFNDYLEQEYGKLELNQIKPTIVRSWLATLAEVNCTAKTINRKISTLKTFYKYFKPQN
jgi:integrase/recombinase XerC